jgi:hypothetical protein
VDGSVLAVKIAQQVDGPVKVVWSREEDIQHDMYRPYYYDRLSAGLDAEGMPVAWTHRTSGSSVMARYDPPLFQRPDPVARPGLRLLCAFDRILAPVPAACGAEIGWTFLRITCGDYH